MPPHYAPFGSAAALAILTVAVVLPAAQQSANSHIGMGPPLGFAYLLVAVAPALATLRRGGRAAPWLSVSLVCGLATASLWTMGCQGCAEGG